MKFQFIFLVLFTTLAVSACRKDKITGSNNPNTVKSCDSIVGAGELVIQEQSTGSYRHYDANGRMLYWYIKTDYYDEFYTLTYNGAQLTGVDYVDNENNLSASTSITTGSNPDIWVYSYTNTFGTTSIDSIQITPSGKLLNLYHNNGTITHYYYSSVERLDSIVRTGSEYHLSFHYSSGQLDYIHYYYSQYGYGNIYFEYDENNRLTKKSTSPQTMTDSYSYNYVYDMYGYLDSVTYTEGSWTELVYDYSQCGDGPIPQLNPLDLYVNPTYRFSASTSFANDIWNF